MTIASWVSTVRLAQPPWASMLIAFANIIRARRCAEPDVISPGLASSSLRAAAAARELRAHGTRSDAAADAVRKRRSEGRRSLVSPAALLLCSRLRALMARTDDG